MTIVISYDAMNNQSDELASQEINETIAGLMNSLRTQVNNAQVSVNSKIIRRPNNDIKY